MKAILGLALLSAASCGPGRTTFARYPNAAPTFDRATSDPKAVELADKVAAAAGGMAKWATVKQLRWAEVVSNNGKPQMEGEEAWDRWNARAMGKLLGDHDDVVVKRDLYGERLEGWGEQAGKRSALPPQETEQAGKVAKERWQFDTAALCMPFLLEEPGTKLSYVGQAQADDGKPLEVLLVSFDPADTARSGTSYQVDIDPTTFQIARIEVVKPGGNIGYRTSGWREVDGMKFPTVESNIGLASEAITFKDLKIGEPEDELYVTF